MSVRQNIGIRQNDLLAVAEGADNISFASRAIPCQYDDHAAVSIPCSGDGNRSLVCAFPPWPSTTIHNQNDIARDTPRHNPSIDPLAGDGVRVLASLYPSTQVWAVLSGTVRFTVADVAVYGPSNPTLWWDTRPYDVATANIRFEEMTGEYLVASIPFFPENEEYIRWNSSTFIDEDRFSFLESNSFEWSVAQNEIPTYGGNFITLGGRKNGTTILRIGGGGETRGYDNWVSVAGNFYFDEWLEYGKTYALPEPRDLPHYAYQFSASGTITLYPHSQADAAKYGLNQGDS